MNTQLLHVHTDSLPPDMAVSKSQNIKNNQNIGGEQVSKYSFSLKFRASSTFPPQANLRHANLSNDEKKSEGDDFAAADKAEAEEARRSVFATNYRLGKTCHAIVLGNKSQLSTM